MRFTITLTCGLFICFSTESKDLLKAAMRLKIPANIGFMLSIALRFIPMIVDESKTVIRAQKLRGFSVINSGIFHPLRTAHFLLRPILVNAVRRSSMLSLSVESRHFDYNRHTFSISSKHGSKIITLVLCAVVTLLSFCIFIKLIHFLYISNYFYASWLRPLYYAAERFL
jgi:energy-coupling factor transport system permease protein